MQTEHKNLPTDVNTLHHMVRDLLATLEHNQKIIDDKNVEIERLKNYLLYLKRQKFGRKAETIDPHQYQLWQEELDNTIAQTQAQLIEITTSADNENVVAKKPRTRETALPAHLPREERHHAQACACAHCGDAMQAVRETVSEQLDYVPASFKVIRHHRTVYRCGGCGGEQTTAVPDQLLARGLPGAGLLTQVVISKYQEHQPLYRQSAIYASREKVNLSRQTLADWMGYVSHWLTTLMPALSRYVLATRTLHTDDTPVDVLDPGSGKTRQGRLWVYRKREPDKPPAVFFTYSPSRKAEHPQAVLKDYRGYLHADGYPGYDALYQTGQITEVACWAHARRKFEQEAKANGSPIAKHVLLAIAQLYHIECDSKDNTPEQRQQHRQEKAKPILDKLHAYLIAQLAHLSKASSLAKAIRYSTERWAALTRYTDDGQLNIDNNPAENAIRGICLGKKNYLFFGSDAGGERAAIFYSLIETCKLNGINAFAYFTDILKRLPNHPINRIDELLPFNWQPKT
jgi:transposase